MKKQEALSVGEIIDRAMAATGHADEYRRQQVCFAWAEVVGPEINRRTVRRWIDRDVMHVCLASAVLKSELSFSATSLISALNSYVGAEVVSKIVFH